MWKRMGSSEQSLGKRFPGGRGDRELSLCGADESTGQAFPWERALCILSPQTWHGPTES